jgi:hypothetical protein
MQVMLESNPTARKAKNSKWSHKKRACRAGVLALPESIPVSRPWKCPWGFLQDGASFLRACYHLHLPKHALVENSFAQGHCPFPPRRRHGRRTLLVGRLK